MNLEEVEKFLEERLKQLSSKLNKRIHLQLVVTDGEHYVTCGIPIEHLVDKRYDKITMDMIEYTFLVVKGEIPTEGED